MTLRARLGIAAGGAVALAVIAVTVAAYAGTRSDLRGQLDSQLQNLVATVIHGRGHAPGAGGLPGGPGYAGQGSPPFAGFAQSGTAARLGDCDGGAGFDYGPGPGEAAGLRAFV